MLEEHDGLTAADEAMRTLREELRVAPSADLLPRVRARIATQPVRSPRWAWVLPVAAALLLAIAALALVRGTRTGPVTSVRTTPPPASPDASVPAVKPPAIERTSGATRHHRRSVPPPPRVEPLVPDGEATRIARYVASMRRQPLVAGSLPSRDLREALAEPPEIASPPLKLTPLPERTPLVQEEGSTR